MDVRELIFELLQQDMDDRVTLKINDKYVDIGSIEIISGEITLVPKKEVREKTWR
jgi:hypothetical protein